MLKGQVNPLMIVAAVVVVLAGLGVMIWKATSGTAESKPVIVKPDNPNDPKYQPNPRLGLAGGGA